MIKEGMDTTLLAGAAQADISPRQPLFLVGYPHVPRISTGIHDPLLATALCLRQGSQAILLIAVDILFINPPTARRLRRRIADATGLPEASVFLSCSHTHSGPVTHTMIAWESDPLVPPPDPDYLRQFETGILDAARAAARRMQPAELAWTAAPISGLGGNRIDPQGPADREAQILGVRAREGDRPWLALSLTYCMHPTVLHEDSTLVSADFPAYVRLQIQEALQTSAPILYHMGPSGNQSPRYAVRAQTFAEAERIGRHMGREVAQALQSLPAERFSATARLLGRLAAVDLPRRRLPDLAEAERRLELCRQTFARLQADRAPHGPLRTAECAVFGAEETVTLARAQAEGRLDDWLKNFLPADVQMLRIGPRALIGFPAELFVEYGLRLRELSRQSAFAISLVNGDLQGYIVTPEAAQQGGYEAANSLFDPAAGERLLATALALLDAPPGRPEP